MNVAEDIKEARTALASGHQMEASRLLNHAVFETLDPELLKEIHELARQGHDQVGHLRQRVLWDHIVAMSELRGKRPQG